MNRRNRGKLVHFASAAWFTLSVGYILVFALWQAGKSWWVIFSLSGHSALLIFLIISLYLFAIFRGVGRGTKIEAEHPLTSTNYYMVFYIAAPLLGGLAGGLGAIGVSRITDYLLVVAIGSFLVTFLVWIIVDPAAGLIEMLLPVSREHRRKRLAQAETMREKERLAKQRLLAEVQAKEELEWVRWGEVLRPYAEKLAALVTSGEIAEKDREARAVDIGVSAWQIGGLSCMRQLHEMALDLCKKKYEDSMIVDYISSWWDGIGSWRNPSLG